MGADDNLERLDIAALYVRPDYHAEGWTAHFVESVAEGFPCVEELVVWLLSNDTDRAAFWLHLGFTPTKGVDDLQRWSKLRSVSVASRG